LLDTTTLSQLTEITRFIFGQPLRPRPLQPLRLLAAGDAPLRGVVTDVSGQRGFLRYPPAALVALTRRPACERAGGGLITREDWGARTAGSRIENYRKFEVGGRPDAKGIYVPDRSISLPAQGYFLPDSLNAPSGGKTAESLALGALTPLLNFAALREKQPAGSRS
jgi:hypothetical protein